ncbi:unnamed protein product [Durusdinium trenchii]|uniref:Pyruvate kinase n=1 Tax=Durusdinium trenchii TaxID=1381693 RepID=A0ABP0H650_9DINO
MYQREDINVGKLLKRLPKAVRSKVQAKEFLDECWTIFKKYDAFQSEKLEGCNLWKALLEALPEAFSQAILKNQYGWSLQQDSVYAFTGCGRDGEPAVSLIKFPEYVKFTLALILHKYSANANVLDCKMALKPQELDHSKRKTKVVASLGPASWSEEMIPKMIEAGTDIFRLNCSHRRGGDFERVYPLIRKYSKMLGRRVEVLGDLQGPKFRVGELEGEPVPLKEGEVVEFGICKDDNDLIKPGRITMKPTTEQLALVKACKVGIDLLIEDGIMKVNVVEKISDTELKVKIIRGGKLKARKGVNVPDCEIDCAALTTKDIEDAEYLLQLDPPVEYICVSFAQKGQDLQELIDIMDRLKVPADKRPKICPKIEKPQALTNIEGIIEKSQALMVARGDLGVELELERVPFAQKLLIARAKKAGLFVINATQMVESMIENPVPTRSEVCDLQNAVFDGADAVMLSGEAASGKFPCEAVMAEADAALEAEAVRDFLKPQVPDGTVVDEANKPQELDDSKRQTQVVASLGPASWSEEMIPKMIASGTNIFRLNCSHRRGGDFERVYPLIRKYAKEMGKKVECLGDLQGPKFRVGELAADPVELKNGDILEFGICKDDSDLIRPGRITMKPTVEQNALVKACKPGTPLLLEDGIMEVKVVEKCSETELKVVVIRGGKLKARKGVNVPDVEIDCAALTEKDIEDAEYLLQLDPPIEYICVSFAQKGQDLQELIDIMDRLKVPADKRPKICPKIEKPQAFTNIEGIIAKSQALMVARGDLGVELGLNRVPFAQKLLIQRAKQAGLFVITATQMVESMIENPVPTRAEVSDLMNAVWDGTDAVMLSGEAATGKFPCEAVMAEASATREAETVKHRLQKACPYVAIDSRLPLRPPRALNCGMALKRQETDHNKRKTKVVASLGPASWSEEMIPKMIQAGADIFRLNCSHRRGGDFERVYPLIRKAAQELGRKVECLGDLQGPKFRVGELASDPIPLKDGDVLEFGICKDDSDLIRPGRITMKPTIEQNALVKACTPGTPLLLEDGIMEVRVVEKLSDTELKVKVVRGGKLKARKGVNVPTVQIDCAALTEKDIEDAEYLLQLEPPIEYICVSFVQKGQDLQELIDIMDRLKIPQERRPKICPKIEKPQALTNIEGIIAKSQALMVARGDLGVELELERVPFAQKLLIRRAKDAGLFVINATQMVESMIEQPIPTRAEVSDLQNAVWDGADAVMLSGEAASGRYPCESVMAEADAALEAESVKHLFVPQVFDDYVVDEANKPRELDDSKRRTKVVASLGPSSWSDEMIQKMILAGTDIFRLNCSHRRGGDFERVYPLIRKHSKELGVNVACLGDLQGPKFRVGELAADPIPLTNGEILEFGICKDDNDTIKPGRITMKPTTEQNALVEACKVGTVLLIEDGLMEVKVTEKISNTELKVEVIRGGKLKARKGVNVPDLEINCAALTSKDIEDAEFLLQLDPPIEYICVSFVQKGQDLQELIDIMDRLKIPAERRPKICAKIEKPQALTNIDGIIAKSQALMVARGDLGVELGLNRVPFAQKLLIARAKQAGLFVINATQVVESMINNPVPTRAEVSDVCNAVWDGADAVMLSGEAASGNFPLEAVMAEASAAREAESVKHRLRRACPPVESGDVVPPMLHVNMGNKKQETNDALRKTKVVASLGPASWSEEMIPKMVAAGTDIFRLNCSHRRGGDFERVYPLIRKAAQDLGRKVECLGDLQGPKFRVGELAGDPIELVNGEILEFGISKDDNDNIRPGRITMKPTLEQNALIAAAKVGIDLLLEDGIMKVNVVEKLSNTELKVKVVRGGKLKLDPPIEYICVSFVQKGQDLQELIDIMDRLKIPQERRPKICPKIEKPQALTNIDGIIAKSEALMVARGDLGVELELERVPFAQKLLIRKAKDAGLFVINATQMVESMIESPVPTRAEVSDLQNAIWDGADAVMLSGEAASGKFPCEAVMAEAEAALEAESVKDLLQPRLGVDYFCDEGNKPREMDDAKRRTKVVASLGPASWSEEMIPKMIEAGTDIFRLNCSHRRGGDFERVYPLIRKTAQQMGKKVECLGDLQGPKFRVGELAGDPVELKNGEIVEFGISVDDNDNIRPGRITMKPTTEQNALVKGCKVGTTLLIEDGIMEVIVTEKLSDTELKVQITRGGKLKARKGVNVPDIEIDCAALTVKDIEDAEFLLQLDPPIEYICVSFAQKAQDLQELIDIMDRLKIPAEKRPKICPKIEKPQALTNIDGIIEKSEALMVARGDLGVELGLCRVPFAQKLLIRKAKQAGLFVITATQMVESMIEAPVPTRAEVSDLCNAVWDGTDAVMLSGEAASGKFPCEAVLAEASAVREAESVEHRVFPAIPAVV